MNRADHDAVQAGPGSTRPPRGERGRRVTIPLARTGDRAFAPPGAEALAEHALRGRRVALIGDAAQAGVESAADFVHHHSGLEITPLAVDTRQVPLADAIAALSPGFAGVCLHRTDPEHTDAVRRRLAGLPPAPPILHTGDDAVAVTVVAALINADRQGGVPLYGSRVLVVDAHTAPEIGALLTAVGARDLTFADSRRPVDAAYDIRIDLSAAGLSTAGPSAADPSTEPAQVVLTVGAPAFLHPLLALPGLLSAAVHRRLTIDLTHRLAAAHALAGLAAPGLLLPDPLDPRITAAVYAAVTAEPPVHRPG